MIDLDKLHLINRKVMMDDGGHFTVQITMPSVALTGSIFVGMPIGFTVELEREKRRIEGVVDVFQYLAGNVLSIGVRV